MRTRPHAFGGTAAERFARMVDCETTASDGAFPAEGSAIVGFRVARVEALHLLALSGR